MQRSMLIVGTVVATAVITSAAYSYATSTDAAAPSVFHACAGDAGVIRSNSLRVDSTPACKKGDHLVTWREGQPVPGGSSTASHFVTLTKKPVKLQAGVPTDTGWADTSTCSQVEGFMELEHDGTINDARFLSFGPDGAVYDLGLVGVNTFGRHASNFPTFHAGRGPDTLGWGPGPRTGLRITSREDNTLLSAYFQCIPY